MAPDLNSFFESWDVYPDHGWVGPLVNSHLPLCCDFQRGSVLEVGNATTQHSESPWCTKHGILIQIFEMAFHFSCLAKYKEMCKTNILIPSLAFRFLLEFQRAGRHEYNQDGYVP